MPTPSRFDARTSTRAMSCPLAIGSGQKKRWGSAPERPPHCRAASYFFFAFLAFLAAFFAFFAIVPPDGSSSCLMATLDERALRRLRNRVSEVHNTLSEPYTLIPDVDYG